MPKALFSLPIVILVLISGLSSAFATTAATEPVRVPQMHCAVGVFQAKDFFKIEGSDPTDFFEVLTMEAPSEGFADQEFSIRGKTVVLALDKFKYSDVYRVNVRLVPQLPELPPVGPGYHSIVSDVMLNAGPAFDPEWDTKSGPDFTRFEFLSSRVGSIGLTTKMIDALKAAGLWGKAPYASSTLSAPGLEFNELVRELMAKGDLKRDDTIGIGLLRNCSFEK